MVEKPRERGAVSVYGQGQCAIPHCKLLTLYNLRICMPLCACVYMGQCIQHLVFYHFSSLISNSPAELNVHSNLMEFILQVMFPSTLLGTGENWTLMKTISVTEYLNYEAG